MRNTVKQTLKVPFLLLCMLLYGTVTMAQTGITVKGTVVDEDDEPVIGANIRLKENQSIGTIANAEGNFQLTVPGSNPVLVISYIGMLSQEVKVGNNNFVRVVLKSDNVRLDEVIVVGYGQQKKASVVGAITQTDAKVLERAASVNDIGAALTGNLPGVITIASSGLPGEEEPQIVIRSASSWNSSEPLVLVDGIERPMSSIDISSVQSISVLKDASATAVYGVKGANGVILITTKRGQEGSAKIDVGFSATMKAASKLPNKYDAYDALMARNVAIEHALSLYPDGWSDMTPQEIIEKYRYPANLEEYERYPNVDWQKELFKDFAMSYNANINVSGGTKFVKYFASADYVHEGDLFRGWDNERNYKAGFGYNRINVRSNLDFTLTKTTKLKVNVAGSTGEKKSPWVEGVYNSSEWGSAQVWSGAYSTAPDVFLLKYSDGTWGHYPSNNNVANSAAQLALAGKMATTTTRINTDFTLEQDLSVITKGLSIRGMVSWDNVFVETHRGINDLNNGAQYKWIDPDTGEATYSPTYNTVGRYDYIPGVLWKTGSGTVQNNQTKRQLNYQLQLNWGRTFGQHDVTGTGVFSRQENATGSEIARYREDWVFRTTYSFAGRYFAEYNGAYNGSEKFGKKYRFGFFNSGALGWMISEEKLMNFLKEKNILDMLKVRVSYGEIGDDTGNRFLYMTQWSYGGSTSLDLNNQQTSSPYTYYAESAVGNPEVHWEKVTKANLGIDYSFLNGLLSGSVDFFRDKRTDILVNGSDRSTPSYFGASPTTANLGRAKTSGYELELRINKTFANNMRVWLNTSMTHAVNKVLEKDDAELLPNYQRAAGYSIGQNKSYIDAGFMGTYDEIYGSPQHSTNESQKLPGDYYIIDFNGDGVIDSNDQTPYGYSSTPQNTYNATIGFEWKGFSAFAQFYGVNNVTRYVNLTSFGGGMNTVYDLGTWWSSETGTGDVVIPRWQTTQNYHSGTQYMFDGSYIRLKNVEVAYTWNGGWIRKLGLKTLKVYLNGNNIWSWSRMPDDRESNFASDNASSGAYPTMKRYSAGVKFTL